MADRFEEPHANPAGRRPRTIHAAILLVTSGLTPLATAVLGPSLPRMQAHFASTPGAEFLVPLALTAPMLVMALLSVVAGALADRHGRKRILVSATALYAIFGTAPLWLQSLPAIFASRILMGVAEAALMTISTMMIGDYYAGRARQRYMSLQTTVAAGAAFVLNVVGGAIGEFGWRAPFAVYAISLPLAVLMGRHLWEPATVAAAAAGYRSGEDGEGIIFRPLHLAGVCAIAVWVGVVFLIVPVHLGYLFAGIGIRSASGVGIAYGLNSLGAVLGTLCFGWYFSNKLNVAGQLALAVGITAVGCVGLGWATTYPALTAAAVINGVGAGLLLPTATTWNMRELPFARRGFGVGAFQSSLFFGMFLNPLVIVGLEKLTGARPAAIGIIGLTLLFVALVIAMYGWRVRSSLEYRPRLTRGPSR